MFHAKNHSIFPEFASYDFGHSLEMNLTLFPSMSKCVKFTVIFHCGGAKTSQMQFLLAGYKSGKEGEVMVPLTASIRPPHASEV